MSARSTVPGKRSKSRRPSMRVRRSRPAPPKPPPMLPGFSHIRRFWDVPGKAWIAQILPGEYYVSTHPEVIATVLGSCISVCIRDVRLPLGGMNHFMLPDLPQGVTDSDALRYGSAAMERLVNELLKHGGDRRRLEAKVFGGGRVLAGVSDIGRRNIEFVYRYLADEGTPIVAQDVGGTVARRVRFEPATGRARVMHLPMGDAGTLKTQESHYRDQVMQSVHGNDAELF